MEQYCPKFTYKLETDDFVLNNQVDNRFHKFEHVFWSFKPTCDAFEYWKSIIQIDSTFLHGKYHGTLLIAMTQDENSCVLSIVFVIVEGETLSAWSWFLANIRLHVIQKQGICLISYLLNQQLEMQWQSPNVYHVYCILHIASNFNHRFTNAKLKHHFEENFGSFREYSPAMRCWIDDISKEKWSLMHDDEECRYGHMITTLLECVNKVLKGARNLPITTLVKCTCGRLVEYFVQRGAKTISELRHGQIYNKNLMVAIQKSSRGLHSSCSCKAFNPVTQRSRQTWTVVLNTRKCECDAFQAFRYPCSHVIAFVDVSYSIKSIINAYFGQWFFIDNNWPTSISLPVMISGKGLPKSTHIRNEMDWRKLQHRKECGYCKHEEHNRFNCLHILEDHGFLDES
ncbi:hypothetical protein CR513_51248, partial [Mucuna pruriens]